MPQCITPNTTFKKIKDFPLIAKHNDWGKKAFAV
jgi:hypothetical protein